MTFPTNIELKAALEADDLPDLSSFASAITQTLYRQLAVRAILAEDLSVLEEALAELDDLDAPISEEGLTLLHIATAFSSEDAVLALLARGASPDQPDRNGVRPIHGAETPEREALLVRWGADPTPWSGDLFALVGGGQAGRGSRSHGRRAQARRQQRRGGHRRRR